jgi:hypothetical protein
LRIYFVAAGGTTIMSVPKIAQASVAIASIG